MMSEIVGVLRKFKGPRHIFMNGQLPLGLLLIEDLLWHILMTWPMTTPLCKIKPHT